MDYICIIVLMWSWFILLKSTAFSISFNGNFLEINLSTLIFSVFNPSIALSNGPHLLVYNVNSRTMTSVILIGVAMPCVLFK